MAIRVDVYTNGGMASGILARTCTLREALSADDASRSTRASGRASSDRRPVPPARSTSPIDDILFAIADDEPEPPVHAAWHHVLLDSGPYTLEGELATMPGFDPGRSLARPTGEFVLLRDVRLSLRGQPEAGRLGRRSRARQSLCASRAIRADLMLGFFFPGAAIDRTADSAGPRCRPSGGWHGGCASADRSRALRPPRDQPPPAAPAPGAPSNRLVVGVVLGAASGHGRLEPRAVAARLAVGDEAVLDRPGDRRLAASAGSRAADRSRRCRPARWPRPSRPARPVRPIRWM